jgi:hypothetical protein
MFPNNEKFIYDTAGVNLGLASKMGFSASPNLQMLPILRFFNVKINVLVSPTDIKTVI